jgi:hypothetical protein
MKKALFLFLILSTSHLCRGQSLSIATVREVFDFSVGDTFQYRLTQCFYACDSWNETSSDFQLVITHKHYSLNNDSVYFGVEKNWGKLHDTLAITHLDSSVLKDPYVHSYFYPLIIAGINHMAGCAEIDTAYIDSSCNGRKHSMAYGGCFAFDIHQVANFVTGLGLFYMQTTNGEGGINNPLENWKLELVYYSKGVERWGNPVNIGTAIERIRGRNEIKMFPNPVKDELTIDLNGAEMNDLVLVITNSVGQVIQERQLSFSNLQKINISSYAPGFYFASLWQINRLITTVKFDKQ